MDSFSQTLQHGVPLPTHSRKARRGPGGNTAPVPLRAAAQQELGLPQSPRQTPALLRLASAQEQATPFPASLRGWEGRKFITSTMRSLPMQGTKERATPLGWEPCRAAGGNPDSATASLNPQQLFQILPSSRPCPPAAYRGRQPDADSRSLRAGGPWRSRGCATLWQSRLSERALAALCMNFDCLCSFQPQKQPVPSSTRPLQGLAGHHATCPQCASYEAPWPQKLKIAQRRRKPQRKAYSNLPTTPPGPPCPAGSRQAQTQLPPQPRSLQRPRGTHL